MSDLRIGQGFDIHPFSDNSDKPLVLGGVVFEGPGLAGHSDGDVVAHASADALLGAAGLDDLGQMFPDTDPSFANAASLSLLNSTVNELTNNGWAIVNVDCVVILEEPKLAPHRKQMQALLAGIVEAQVTVRGRHAEGLGPIGQAEGIACLAVALIRRL